MRSLCYSDKARAWHTFFDHSQSVGTEGDHVVPQRSTAVQLTRVVTIASKNVSVSLQEFSGFL